MVVDLFRVERRLRPRVGAAVQAVLAALAVLAGLAVLAILASGCAETAPRAPTSIVLLIADGVRADALEGDEMAAVIGHHFGDGALRFERAYAASSLAPQSLASLFAGRLPTHGGSIGLAEAQPSDQAETLAQRLRGAGYRTALITQASWGARPGFTRGFGDLQIAPDHGWSDDDVIAAALRVIEDWRALDDRAAATRAAPGLVVVHWSEPELGGAIDSEAAQQAYGAALVERATAIDRLLEALDRAPEWAPSLRVLTASHGFELLEHGGLGSGWTLHEEVIRVPLLLQGPGVAPLREEQETAISLVELGPLLLDLAGAAPGSRPASAATEEPLITELVVRERAILRAAIEGEQKLVQVVREVPPADRAAVERGYEELQAAMASGAISTPAIFGEPRRELLVGLDREGGALVERELALQDAPQAVSRLRAVLRDYQRRCESEGWAPRELTEKLVIDPGDAAELTVLGYL